MTCRHDLGWVMTFIKEDSMKLVIATVLALCGLTAFAMEHQGKNWDKLTLEQQKQMKLKMLDDKSAWIESTRSCVTQAKDKVALKNCKDEMKPEKQAMEHVHTED